jgi:hypothetical protein
MAHTSGSVDKVGTCWCLSIQHREGKNMGTRLRVGLSLLKSLMTCLAIITLSVCGLFIRLRPTP